MNAIDTLLDGGQAVRETEAAVAVAMPVELHRLAGGRDDLVAHEAHEPADAIGGRVSYRIGEAETPGAPANRVSVQRLERVRRGAGRVLGDEHDGQPLADRERDGLLAHPQHLVEGPVLGVLPDGRRAD